MPNYIVQSGDTFNSIARVYGIPLSSLIQANPEVTDPDQLIIGQNIYFPTGYPLEKMVYVNSCVFMNIDSQILQNVLEYLTFLSICGYHVMRDGSLYGSEIDETAIIQQARQAHVAPLLLISNVDDNGYISSDLAHELLADKEAQQTLIDNIIYLLQTKNYYGLNIYFEDVYPSDKGFYTSFYQAVTQQLFPLGYVVVATDTLDINPNRSYLSYDTLDFEYFSRYVNQVFIVVSYAFRDPYGPPMATIPLDELRQILNFAVSIIPSQSILMGLTLYGLDWTIPYNPEIPAQLITYDQVKELAGRKAAIVQFDEATQSPYFYYLDDMGLPHIIWFNNEQSLRLRLALVRIYNLGGISFWTTFDFSSDVFQILDSMFIKVRKVL